MNHTADPVEDVDVSADLLSDVPGDICDLFRKDSTIGVRVIFLPDIDKPEQAHIVIFHPETNKVIEQLEVKVDPVLYADDPKAAMDKFTKEVMSIYHHPAIHSNKAADKISGRAPAAAE